jgi:hypothetical protein
MYKTRQICSLFDIQNEEDLSSNRSENNFNIANAAAISIEVTIRSQSKIFDIHLDIWFISLQYNTAR